MERGKENEEQTKGEDNKSLVSSRVVLGEDIVNLLDFIERLNSGRVRTSLDMDQIEELTLELTFVSAFCHVYYSFFLESCNDEMSNEIHDLVQSLFHPSGVDMLVSKFCFTLLDYQVDKFNESVVSLVNFKLANLLVEVMHICCTNLKGSNLEEVGCFIKQLQDASLDILRVSLIHLQEHMVNALTPRVSTCNIHVMIEFLLIILTDVPKDDIRPDKLFVLLTRVRELTKEVFVLVRNLEENMNEASDANLNLLENIELLKEDLKNDFLKARADSSQLRFPMSDGPLFMTLLLTNLNDLVNSNAYSVALIKEEIKQVKEDLEIIRSFFGYVEQELHRDLWTRVLDVAYEAEHAINSIIARDHGLLQLIFILPDTVEKIKLVKRGAHAPNKPVERNSSITVGKIIVGFEEETEWIIRKLTSGPAEIDVISIVGMPGIGKTTLAYRVYNDKSIVDHFDVCAWCTVDQERNEKKLLQKIFNQVIGLKERFNEDHDIDDDVADQLRKELF